MLQPNRAFLGFLLVLGSACVPDRTVGPSLAPTRDGPSISVRLRSDSAPSGMSAQIEIVPVPVIGATTLKGTHTQCGAIKIPRAHHDRNVSRIEGTPPYSDSPPQN